jgi:hypothetical protein
LRRPSRRVLTGSCSFGPSTDRMVDVHKERRWFGCTEAAGDAPVNSNLDHFQQGWPTDDMRMLLNARQPHCASHPSLLHLSPCLPSRKWGSYTWEEVQNEFARLARMTAANAKMGLRACRHSSPPIECKEWKTLIARPLFCTHRALLHLQAQAR